MLFTFAASRRREKCVPLESEYLGLYGWWSSIASFVSVLSFWPKLTASDPLRLVDVDLRCLRSLPWMDRDVLDADEGSLREGTDQ